MKMQYMQYHESVIWQGFNDISILHSQSDQKLMAEAKKIKKIDKEFVLSDSSVNCYGYRLLTEGFQIDSFKKNPIGFYMHLRDEGVIVRWEDIRIDGDRIMAKPVINLSNKRGQQTVDEIENGFLNGASNGSIVALEWSDDDALKLNGQTGVTITKWYPKEITICDLPGNENSLQSLFYEDGQELKIADLSLQNFKMKQNFLTQAQLSKLNLTADDDAAKIDNAINDLVTKAARLDEVNGKLLASDLALKTAEEALSSFKAATTTKEVENLLDKALNIDKKITAEVKTKLEKQYATNPVGLKDLLDVMPSIPSVTKEISKGVSTNLSDKSWNELDKSGKLEDLKASHPDLFKQKYKEEFGTDYKGE